MGEERRPFNWLHALLLVGVVLLLYSPVAQHEFVRYDDDVYITDNPHIAKGLDADEIGWVFGHAYASNYHPLTWVSHMLDVELFGLDPGPHHIVNVLLHALNAVLVMRLLWILLWSSRAAGLGAVFFALHPLRVESVAWAAERKDLLCAAFWLLALLAYLRHGCAPSLRRFGLVCLLLVLALLSKPTAVVFPLAALCLDRWALGRLGPQASREVRRRAWLEKIPLFALAGAGALLTLWAQSRGGATSTLGDLPFDLRFMNALRTLAVILGDSFLPSRLSVFYPHVAVTSGDPRSALLWPALAGTLALAGLLALAWRRRDSAPAVALGVWWFLVPLLPVIGLIQVGTQAHADRYTYLPAVGLSLALAGLALSSWKRHRQIIIGFGIALGVTMVGKTRDQIFHWRNTRALFEHALDLERDNWVAAAKLGELALEEGDAPRAKELYQQSVDVHPGYAEGLLGLALAQRMLEEPDRARAILERLLRLYPDDFEARLSLGVVEMERGEHARAREHLEACLAAAPGDARVPYDLGCLAQAEGDAAGAEGSFRATITLDPGHVDAWSHLGQMLLATERLPEALAAFTRAAELAPDDGFALFNLGVAQRALGNADGAEEAFERALQLEPDLETALEALMATGEER